MDQKRKEQRIPIPEDVCTYLQMLKYEADGLRVLCVQAAESGLPEEKQAELIKNCRQAAAAWRRALYELVCRLVPGEELEGAVYSVDFLQGELKLGRACNGQA